MPRHEVSQQHEVGNLREPANDENQRLRTEMSCTRHAEPGMTRDSCGHEHHLEVKSYKRATWLSVSHQVPQSSEICMPVGKKTRTTIRWMSHALKQNVILCASHVSNAAHQKQKSQCV